jgi:hypothetical protein
MKRAFGSVDRQIRKVWTAEPLQLRIEIGEIATLQQGSFVKSTPGTIFCVQKATCSEQQDGASSWS